MKTSTAAEREQYLKFLQHLLCDPRVSAVTPKNDEMAVAALDDVMRVQVKGDQSKLRKFVLTNTHMELSSTGQFFTFDKYVRREAEKVLCALGGETRRQIETRVTFGSLPTSELNGMCIRTPDQGYLVIINVGNFALCEIVANVVSGLTMFSSGEGNSTAKFTVEEAAEFLLDVSRVFPAFPVGLFDRYRRFRTVLGDQEADPGLYRSHFSPALGDGLMNFVIAHEIAHFVRGHIGSSPLKILSISTSGAVQTNVEELEFQHSQEFEADVLGAALLVIGAENSGGALDGFAAMVATQVFFLMLELMEHVKGIKPLTHPAAYERRKNLLRELDYTRDALEFVEVFEVGLFASAKSMLRGKA